ncbi:MAG: hypothetical protein HC924_13520 [Synechococcaceae cyanobacterium SM2_3_2]|nr:hypothetical protein [Synechococcaceae cyanobacterium SM2_3_2]
MVHLTAATLRRLRKLPQAPSVWEGDRQPLVAGMLPMLQGARGDGICLLWVDGSAGMVRSMDVVPPDTGHEAMVRSLLQAMESPQGAPPARPQKIIVRDRELHFYLRGILSELDIKVEWQPELPLIDEIYSSFEGDDSPFEARLPEPYDTLLPEKAGVLWQDAPWDYLADHQVLAIKLNQFDIDTLYVSVMGMLGMEYGILFYRSLQGLQQFRNRIQAEDDMDRKLEEAFLQQDCLFVTYDAIDEDDTHDLGDLRWDWIEPSFGIIHPLEGLRPTLDGEEAAVLMVAMEALHRFLKKHHRTLEEDFVECTGSYRVPDPSGKSKTLTVEVSSLPQIATELLDEEPDQDPEDGETPEVQFLLREDLIPEQAEMGLGLIPWMLVSHLEARARLYRVSEQELAEAGEGLPVLIIRTSRPKAKVLIETLQAAGNPHSICFNPGLDPFSGNRYELEILQTGNGEFHLIGEFSEKDASHVAARKQWDRRCRTTGGVCGLLIAMGVNSTQRQAGIVDTQHMMALFELRALSPDHMGLGPMMRFGYE